MTVPTFVGAGSGIEVTSGSQTLSKSSCTAGNFILIQTLFRGPVEDFTTSSETNMTLLAGGSGLGLVVANRGVGDLQTSRMSIYVATVTADGTCSASFSVGGSGNDFVARMYEFSGQKIGTTYTQIMENGGSDVNGS